MKETISDKSILLPEIFDTIEIRKAWEEYLADHIGLHFEIDALLSFGSLDRLIPWDGLEL